MQRYIKNDGLWFPLTISISFHFIVLTAFTFSAWDSDNDHKHSVKLVIHLAANRPAEKHDLHKKQSLPAESTGSMQNKTKKPPHKEKVKSDTLSRDNTDRPVSQPALNLDHSSHSTGLKESIPDKRQGENQEKRSLKTPRATTLVERSIAMIRNMRLEPEEKDFSKYLLAKRLEGIKHIERLLNDEQMKSLQRGDIEEFTNSRGETYLTFYLGNGDKVCYEMPADSFASSISDPIPHWRTIKC